MAEIHQLIIKHGIEEARRQAITKHERMVIEAAYQVLSDDAEKMGFTYSGFALTSLPHKPQSELTWKRDGHNLTMLIQSGVDRAGKPLGLPYGSYARFILWLDPCGDPHGEFTPKPPRPHLPRVFCLFLGAARRRAVESACGRGIRVRLACLRDRRAGRPQDQPPFSNFDARLRIGGHGEAEALDKVLAETPDCPESRPELRVKCRPPHFHVLLRAWSP